MLQGPGYDGCKSMSRITLGIIVLLATPVMFAPQSHSDETAQAAVVLEGTIQQREGAPLAQRTVFSFPVDQSGQIVTFAGITDDGVLLPIEPDAHPHAKTDSNGRFRIDFSDSIAVYVSGDTVLIGSNYTGVTVGVFASEDLQSLPPFTGPTFLTSKTGEEAQPTMKMEGDVLLIQFGELVVPD